MADETPPASLTQPQRWWCDPPLCAAVVSAPVIWAVMTAWAPSPWIPGWVLVVPGRLLAVALVYPLLEEILFRGLLQGGLWRRPWGRKSWGPVSCANLLTSLLFALLHTWTHPPLMAAAVLVPSLVFGWFRDRDGGLLIPVALHAYYNTGYFLIFG